MSSEVVNQTEAIYGGLSDYFKSLSEYLSSGTGYPSFPDIVGSLTFDELHRYASVNSDGGLNTGVGSAIDTAHHSASVLREYALMVKSKTEYYQSAISDHSNESGYYGDRKAFQSASIKGNTASGASD